MFNTTGYAGPSLADISAVTRNTADGSWANGNGWWVLIILFAIFGGWGNNGYRNAGTTDAATQADIQRSFDTQTILGSLRGLEQGICSSSYAALEQTNGINSQIAQSNWDMQQAVNNASLNNMQSFNSLERQLSDCCCENRQAIAQVRYDMSTNCCAIQNSIERASNAQIQNSQNLYNMLDKRIDNLVLDQKNQQIAMLQAQLNRCDRNSALLDTASYIINTVKPQVVPAVPAAQYYGVGNVGCGCYGQNSGCCG